MRSDRHERISERAYQIWLAEGRVHGRHQDHWHRAEREIAAEEAKATRARPARTRATKAATTSEASPKAVSRSRAKLDRATAKAATSARPSRGAAAATKGRGGRTKPAP